MQENTIRQFTEDLASKAPVPGGGGGAALLGAIGISLGNMVGQLTIGKKKYADVEEEILDLIEEGNKLREELLSLMDKDAEAFAPLAAAYSLPKDEPNKDEIMEDTLRVAAEAPLEIMRAGGKALELIKVYGEKGSRLAVSDAGCGAAACKACLDAASLNVFINTKSMKDRDYAEALNKEADELLDKYRRMAEDILQSVSQELR